MIYRAIQNFRIDKWVMLVGDVYIGGHIDILLSKGLIKVEGELSQPSQDGDETEPTPSPTTKKKKKAQGA